MQQMQHLHVLYALYMMFYEEGNVWNMFVRPGTVFMYVCFSQKH